MASLRLLQEDPAYLLAVDGQAWKGDVLLCFPSS